MAGSDSSDDGSDVAAESLEASIVDHIGVPLWLTSRQWVREMYRRAALRGFADVTETDSEVLAYLPLKGLSISALARRRGVTKQAMQEAVRSLVKRGVLALEADPADRRARRVVYTRRGLEFVAAFQAIKRDMQAEVVAVLGADGVAALETGLAQVRTALGAADAPDP